MNKELVHANHYAGRRFFFFAMCCLKFQQHDRRAIGAALDRSMSSLGWLYAAGLSRDALQFYALRFLLGMPSGFCGLLLYMTYWFPALRAASRAITSQCAVAGDRGPVLASFSACLLRRPAGLKSWQWMFVIEGFAIVAVFSPTGDARPSRDARWLTLRSKACRRRSTRKHARSPRICMEAFDPRLLHRRCYCSPRVFLRMLGASASSSGFRRS